MMPLDSTHDDTPRGSKCVWMTHYLRDPDPALTGPLLYAAVMPMMMVPGQEGH